MNFSSVEKIAAAVLYEGYILYPYRSTAIKNRQRWNFGTLYPQVYAEQQRPQEAFHLVAEFLALADHDAALDLRISFVQLVRQQSSCVPPALADPSLAWDEAIERTSEHPCLNLNQILSAPLVLTPSFDAAVLPESRGSTPLPNLNARLHLRAARLPDGSCRLHLELTNITPLPSGPQARRDEALPHSFVSAHVIIGITGGEFLSLLDPPAAFATSAATCKNVGVFPVLAGDEPERTILFCSPIILYDYPTIAPESEGDFFDSTEMDEMLTLRVLTLTDAEKEEMRHGDPRARRILERTESLTGDEMLKAHGIVRSLQSGATSFSAEEAS